MNNQPRHKGEWQEPVLVDLNQFHNLTQPVDFNPTYKGANITEISRYYSHTSGSYVGYCFVGTLTS